MSLFDGPLEAPAKPVSAEWKQIDPAGVLTHEGYTEGLKLLSPIIYAADTTAAEGNASAYWTILHGNPDPNSEPLPGLAWVTNAVWGELCVQILRQCAKMPKPAELETLLLLKKPKDFQEVKALPATGTITQASGKIRTQNMVALRDFQRACTAHGESLMGKGGVRDSIFHQCEREGLTGDVLRLTVAVRLQEAIMQRERPVMPTFLGDGGRPIPESLERSERWNGKDDVAQRLGVLRAELSAATAEEA